jgi:hypothetical protein
VVKKNKHEKLRAILVDYQEEGYLSEWLENHFLGILKRVDESIYYSWEKELTKTEKKLFVRMLKDFGQVDNAWGIPLGKSMEAGYGSRVQLLIKAFTPKWRRWLKGSIGLLLSSILVGGFTNWLFNSFAIGIFTVLIFRVVHDVIRYIPIIYFQNELLIRRSRDDRNEEVE